MGKVSGLKDLIRTMHDLEDLTNVLEQVAARDIARMRKDIVSNRMYFQELWNIYRIVKQIVPPPTGILHKRLVVIVGIDWGMPGNLLNRIIEVGEDLYRKEEADLLIAGKMAQMRFHKDSSRTTHMFSLPKNANLESMEPIYKVVAKYSHVTVIYPRFESTARQTVATADLAIGPSETAEPLKVAAARYIVEPDPQIVADYMNDTIIGATLYHYFAEAKLAYSAAQMLAMRDGHDNARGEVRGLTVKYNRARRAMIDTKLRELQSTVMTQQK